MRKNVAGDPAPTAAALDPEAVVYVNKLAAVLRSVMEAQSRWIPEIDAVSPQQSLVNDAGWRQRLTDALTDLVRAAEGLRIEPVPARMLAADAALADAESEARLAGQGFADAVQRSDLRTLLAAVEHIDRMNQLIQRARTLISG